MLKKFCFKIIVLTILLAFDSAVGHSQPKQLLIRSIELEDTKDSLITYYRVCSACRGAHSSVLFIYKKKY